MLSKTTILILSGILLLVHRSDAAFGFRSAGGQSGKYNQQGYRNDYYKASSYVAGVPNQGSALTSEQKPAGDQAKGSKGLSAWGIVAIIIGIILLGAGAYYAFVFYPYICKKERNYDMIELTNVL